MAPGAVVTRRRDAALRRRRRRRDRRRAPELDTSGRRIHANGAAGCRTPDNTELQLLGQVDGARRVDPDDADSASAPASRKVTDVHGFIGEGFAVALSEQRKGALRYRGHAAQRSGRIDAGSLDYDGKSGRGAAGSRRARTIPPRLASRASSRPAATMMSARPLVFFITGRRAAQGELAALLGCRLAAGTWRHGVSMPGLGGCTGRVAGRRAPTAWRCTAPTCATPRASSPRRTRAHPPGARW